MLLFVPVCAGDEAQALDESVQESPVIASEPVEAEAQSANAEEQEQQWMDRSHKSVTNLAGKLAVWADGFFGSARAVTESPSSVLRLRPEYEWDEQEGNDWNLRANGRLKLPRLNERLSLAFITEDGNNTEEFYDPGIVSDGKSTAGLEYRLAKSETSKVSLVAALKSGPKGKLGGRYRYQVPFWQRNRFRFSEELFWIGGDGFGTLTRVDIDRSVDKDLLLRWANKAEYSEESSGVEWSTQLSLVKKLDAKSAFRSFTFLDGETDPKVLNNRGLGVAYRRQFLREWLFWEIEPRYSWRKRWPEDDREGVTTVQFKLEMVFSSE